MASEGGDSQPLGARLGCIPCHVPPHLPTADKTSPGATIILTGLLPLDLSDPRPHSAMLSNISRALSPSLSPSQEVPVLPAPGFQFLDKHSNCGLVCHTACPSAAKTSSRWAPARVRSRLLIVPLQPPSQSPRSAAHTQGMGHTRARAAGGGTQAVPGMCAFSRPEVHPSHFPDTLPRASVQLCTHRKGQSCG